MSPLFIALQIESATVEAITEQREFTVIGWVDGDMLACIGNNWVAL